MIDGPNLQDFYDLRIVFISAVWVSIATLCVSALHRRRRTFRAAPLIFHFAAHVAMAAEVFAIIYAASDKSVGPSSIEDPDAVRMSKTLLWIQRCTVLVWLVASRWMFVFVPRSVVAFSILLPVVSEWCRVSLQLLSDQDIAPAQLSVDCIVVVCEVLGFCSVIGWQWLFVTDVELLFRQIPATTPDGAQDLSDGDSYGGAAREPQIRFSDTLPLDNALSVEGAEEDMKPFWFSDGSIGRSLWMRYKTTLIALGLVRIVFDALALLPAWLLRVLVDTLSSTASSTGENVRVSAVVIALLVISAIVGTLMRAHYNLALQRISISNRGLLSDCITRHCLRTRNARLYNQGKGKEHRATSQGDIINHMTVDAQRISDGLGGLYDLWALPLQTCLTLYLLYVQVSFAFVAGIVITLALIPVNMLLAKKISRVNTNMLAFNDERVLCINEVMNNIIYVKMCGWSPLMAEWIRVPREKYMKCLRWVKMLDAMCVFFWATTPVFVSLSTFALYIAIGGDLTPGRAVAALSLFNALILPLNAYPWVINGTVEAYVSLQRLQNFLGPFVRKESMCIVAQQRRLAPPMLWPCPSASDLNDSSDDHSSDNDDASPPGKDDEKKSFLRRKFRTSKRRHAPGATGINSGDVASSDVGSRERSIPSIFSSGKKPLQRDDASDDSSLAQVTDVLVSLQNVRYAHVFHECGPEEKRVTQVKFVVEDGAMDESETPRSFSLGVPRFQAKQRELITIVGAAGSGKSTFLAGIAGETWRVDHGGQQSVCRDSVAYVEQVPFLFSGTVKSNILCGLPFRKDLFDSVMRRCALDVDMREFHERENTQLGDRGSGLSGGQKFRVALARALYADKKLYIIDDCLGSLDAEVANHVVDHVYAALPREGKGVVVATHSFDVIARSHRTYVAANNTLRPLTTHERDVYLERSGPPAPSGEQRSEGAVDSVEEPTHRGGTGKGISLDEAAAGTLERLGGGGASGSVVQVAVQLSEASAGNQRELAGSLVSGTCGNEVTASGSVSLASVKYYMSHVGYVTALVVVIFIVAMQAARNLGDWLIAVWVSDVNASSSTLLQTLGVLAAVNAVLAMVRGVSFAVAGLTAARTIHHELLDAILGASYHFFMKTSPGRIINRLSRDIYNIDDSLPFTLNILLAQLFLLIGSVVIVIINSSWVVVTLLIPVALANYSVQRPYRRVSREVKRLESAARSPLIDDLRRLLEGGAVLRAFGPDTMTYYHKRARANLTLFLRTNANMILLQAWFGIRLQLIGCLVLGFVGAIAVYYHNAERAAALGLALAYVAPLTSYISGVLSSFVDTEKQFVSVERVIEYLTTESEAQSLHLVTAAANATASTADDAPRRLQIHGSVWPLFGTIQFNDVSMRYDTDGPLILRNVTFQVDAGEKVAVVGRTGAGKTSLFVALLRLLRLQKGSIMIDSEDIQRIDPEQLRQRLAVFPQDPFLFHGTVRKNVDPFDKATDDEVAAVLRRVQLFHLSPTFVVHEGGKNLSTGQRYLVALARVALQQSCILLLDEPSAKIDRAADAQLWTQIDTLFRDCTVLTITHNLDHIDWFDRVIVLDRGVIIGCGTPSDLRREGLGPFGAL